MKFTALLRGINVGGHKIIPMAALKTIFESAGFKNVSTFIQSGNILFDSSLNKSGAIRAVIEKKLLSSLGYDVTTLVRTLPEMKKVVAKNPFTEEHSEGKTKFYVVFLEKKPSTAEQQKVLATQVKGMLFHFGACEIYCLLDAKFTGNNSPFSNTKIEKLLNQRTTTRNWATVNALTTLGAAKNSE